MPSSGIARNTEKATSVTVVCGGGDEGRPSNLIYGGNDGAYGGESTKDLDRVDADGF